MPSLVASQNYHYNVVLQIIAMAPQHNNYLIIMFNNNKKKWKERMEMEKNKQTNNVINIVK